MLSTLTKKRWSVCPAPSKCVLLMSFCSPQSYLRLNLSQVWQSAVLLPGIPHPGTLPVGKLNPKYARSTLNYPWLHCGTSESSKVGDVGPICPPWASCPIIPGANIPLSKASPWTSFAHKFESLSGDQKARLNILGDVHGRLGCPPQSVSGQWSLLTIVVTQL